MPDSHEAFNNWGSLLSEQARRASGEERSLLLAAAASKLERAMQINSAHSFNLACLRALQSDETGCRVALENAEKHGTLPSLDHLMVDGDLDSVRETQWFKGLIERLAALKQTG